MKINIVVTDVVNDATCSRKSVITRVSELGLFPLIISILANCINFWLHTIHSHRDSLVHKAYGWFSKK